MTDKPKKPLTDAQIKARSLNRWENEGGAATSPASGSSKTPKRPRDPKQHTKMAAVDSAAGEAPEPKPEIPARKKQREEP